MNKFIRLSTRIVNPRHIEQIVLSADKYMIYMSNRDIDGFFIFGSGGVNTTDGNYIKVCKKTSPVDYDIIGKLIKENT